MNIKLFSDRVLIELDNKETKTDSGLIVPIKNEPGDIRLGTVVAVGGGKLNDYGKRMLMSVRVGNKVIFQYGMPMSLEGGNYILVNESDIIMILI